MGPICVTSLVFEGISRWARVTPPGVAADSRIRVVPSGRRAPRTYFPSEVTCGIRAGAPFPLPLPCPPALVPPPAVPGRPRARRPAARVPRRRGTGKRRINGVRVGVAQDPGHGPGTRRLPGPVREDPGAGRGQQVLVGGRDPAGHRDQGLIPADHRRHDQRQDAGQRMPYAARVTGIGDGREDLLHDPAAAGRASFPDPVQHRLPLPACRPAQPLVPFPLLSGLPFPFFPGQALPSLLAGLPCAPASAPGPLPPGRSAPPRRAPPAHLRPARARKRAEWKIGVQRGPPGGWSDVRSPSSYRVPRCPAPGVTRPERHCARRDHGRYPHPPAGRARGPATAVTFSSRISG